jgi:hypothetical protein
MMRYEIELLAHNGVAGKNSVEPFAGAIELLIETEGELPREADEQITEDILVHEGREFSHAYTLRDNTSVRYCYRERVEGEPSDWAKARAAEQAARA